MSYMGKIKMLFEKGMDLSIRLLSALLLLTGIELVATGLLKRLKYMLAQISKKLFVD